MKKFALGIILLTVLALTAPAAGVSAVGTNNGTTLVSSPRISTGAEYDRVKRVSRNAARKRLGAQEYERDRQARLQKIRAARLAREKAERIRAARLRAAERARQQKIADKKRAAVQRTESRGTVGHVAPGGPAACIRKYESGGNYRAENPSSSASGAYQFIDSTWRAITGRSDRAKDAPPAVQDAAFYELWDGGRGAHHWVTASRCGY